MFIPILQLLRTKINCIDHMILSLLEERNRTCIQTRHYKSSIACPERETQILHRLYRKSHLEQDMIRDVWKTIFLYSKKSQRDQES